MSSGPPPKRMRQTFHQPLDLSELVDKSRRMKQGNENPQSQDIFDPTIPVASPLQLFKTEPNQDISNTDSQLPTDIAIASKSFYVADTPTSMDSSSNNMSSLSSHKSVMEFYAESQRAQLLLKIQQTVKFNLFRNYKFIDKEVDMMFNAANDSICGFMLNQMHVLTDQEQWWNANKKQIRNNHTMHRNNTIKNIHNKFKGTFCNFVVCFADKHLTFIF
jgi:hypothetical protein